MFNPGSETPITLPDGRTFTLGRLEVRHIRALRDFVAAREGDPFELAERFLGKIPQEESLRMIREAEEIKKQLRCFSLACPLAQKHLATEEGLAFLLLQLLRGHHPQATESEALAVGLYLSQTEETAAVLAAAQGEASAKNAAAPG